LAKPRLPRLPLECPAVPGYIVGQGRINQLKLKAEDSYSQSYSSNTQMINYNI